MPARKPIPAAALALIALLAGASLAATGAEEGDDAWVKEKCARYTKAWTQALARLGTHGLGQEFLSHHEAFLTSGCTAPVRVCPRSPEELELANIMVISAMNAGMASTFPPFACGR
jgi:hypothetical protein